MVYDKDGSKYNIGKGLTVFVDEKKAELIKNNGKYSVVIGAPIVTPPAKQPANFALNIAKKGYPVPSASVNAVPDSLYQAIDGRIWYFPEITNRWSTLGSTSKIDWFALDFGQTREISSIKIYLFADGKIFDIPDSISIEYQNGRQWMPVKIKEQQPVKTIGNTVNTIAFDKDTSFTGQDKF